MQHPRREDERRYIRADRSGLTAAIAVAGLLCSVSPVIAASVPAWLDDAITEHNAEHPEIPIEFVDIRNSFVWFMTPKSSGVEHARIRESIYEIARENGYVDTELEELVTTAKPPSPTNPTTAAARKCWTRSFTLNLEAGRQRLLTTLVCDDADHWLAGFRTAN